MKKAISIFLSLLLIVSFTVTSFGISNVDVKSIKLNSKSISITIGKTYDLKVTVQPLNAGNQGVIFTSSDKGIAAVDKNGRILGLKAGKTVITASSSGNKKAYAKCIVTVKPPEKVKLIFWHTYGDAEDPFFKDIVLPLFNKEYPNIEIESVRQAGEYNQLITTSLGTGETPDVARVEITAVANYANQGGIISLDGLEGFNELKAECLEAPMATNLFKGKYYGMPLDTNCKAAVMNMDVMKQLGFKEPPKTMEEIINASRKFSPGKFTINVSGFGDWDTYAYFTLFGGVIANRQYTKTTGFMDSPQSIAALQKMIDLHKENIFTIRDLDGTPDAWAEIAKKDGYAMFFEGPWYFSANPKFKENNIVPAPIPTYNGKSSSIVGGEDIVIFKNSKHPKEAFQFIKFMLSKNVQLLMASKGQYPVLKTAANSEILSRDPIASIYQKQLESAVLRIPSAQNSTIGQIWSDQIAKAMKGECSAEAALKAAAKAIDEELVK